MNAPKVFAADEEVAIDLWRSEHGFSMDALVEVEAAGRGLLLPQIACAAAIRFWPLSDRSSPSSA